MPQTRPSLLFLLMLLLLFSKALASESRNSSVLRHPPGTTESSLVYELEVEAGPLLGLDPLFRGGCLAILLGAAFKPFELAVRGAAAYDLVLKTPSARLDICLGLGSGARLFLGGVVAGQDLAIAAAETETVSATFSDWPNRFGLAIEIMDLPLSLLGARWKLASELAYVRYRMDSSRSLAGALAFAAGVEARVGLELLWLP